MSKFVAENYVHDGTLDLSLSQLKELPFKNKLKLSTSVTGINLSNNLLVTIPPHLCSLLHIQEMDLSKNKLKSLPDNFGDLVNLKKLDLYDNQLSYLPLSFSKLQKLRWLDVSSNPLSQGLQDIVGSCQNTKECEAAARNVVNYFQLLEQKLNQEMIEPKKKRNASEKNDVNSTRMESKVKKPKKDVNNDNSNQIVNTETVTAHATTSTDSVSNFSVIVWCRKLDAAVRTSSGTKSATQ